jgi:hypothetical protein
MNDMQENMDSTCSKAVDIDCKRLQQYSTAFATHCQGSFFTRKIVIGACKLGLAFL